MSILFAPNPSGPESPVRFAKVMDQLPEEILVSDEAGQILFVNQAFELAKGISRDRILGHSIQVLGDELGEADQLRVLCQAMETRMSWKGKLESLNPEKDARFYQATVILVKEGTAKGPAFVSVRRDLDLVPGQGPQASKMAAIGTLASGIAHDFNNILAGIVGYAELVKEDLEVIETVSPKTQARLDNMITGAMRAKHLIQQIMTFSRATGTQKHPVRVDLLVKEVAQLLRAFLPSFIRMDLSLDSSAEVLADPTQIYQVLMNLCTNARDAMADTGGQLTIRLSDVPARGKTLPASGPAKVRLIVADTGPGIDPGIRHRVLEPFFTTKSHDKGTGMGLFMVHSIVEELGGDLELRQNLPSGVVVDVLLPACPACQGQGEEDDKDPAPVRGKGEFILFVDDETDLTAIARDGLTKLGYRVKGFDDSLEALAWFQQNPAVPDLLISDVTMPDLTGDRLIAEMRKLRPDLPALLITGASERITPETMRTLGVAALLYKPMVLREMSRAIQRALDRERKWQKS